MNSLKDPVTKFTLLAGSRDCNSCTAVALNDSVSGVSWQFVLTKLKPWFHGEDTWKIFEENVQAQHRSHPNFSSFRTRCYDSISSAQQWPLLSYFIYSSMNSFSTRSCNILKLTPGSSPYFYRRAALKMGIVCEHRMCISHVTFRNIALVKYSSGN